MSEFCGKIIPPDFGAYTGAYIHEYASENSINQFNSIQGAPINAALKFLSFEQIEQHPLLSLDYVAGNMSKTNGTIFVKLEPWSRKGKKDQSYSLKDIATGKYDHILIRFAKAAMRLKKPIFVTFGHEMNANWYPWGNKPAQYKAAFQHVHKIISQHACNITWVFNPDKEPHGEKFYPGDAYVDWVMVDGYNKTGRGSIEKIFDFNGRLKPLKDLGKPLGIGEFGCGSNTATKCYTDYVDFMITHPEIKATFIFNTNKEKPWAIDQRDEKRVYKKAIADWGPYFKQSLKIKKPTTPPAPASTTLATKPTAKVWKTPNIEAALTPKLDSRELEKLLLEDDDDKLFMIMKQIAMAASKDVNKYIGQGGQINVLPSEDKIFEARFPIFKLLSEIDRTQGTKLVPYFMDSDEFWNSIITIIITYAGRCIEKDDPAQIKQALTLVRKLRIALDQKISREKAQAQKTPNSTTVKIALPGNYSMGSLMIAEAELLGQHKEQNRGFYLIGLRLAARGLELMRKVEAQIMYPSKADYFSILKGILVVADLYQQLGHVTTNLAEKTMLFSKANILYGKLITLSDQPGSSSFTVSIGNDKYIGRDLHLPITISHKKIQAAFDYNQHERGYITAENRELATKGIYLYIKGLALAKQTGLFTGLPKLKKPVEVLQNMQQLDRAKKHLTKMKEYLARHRSGTIGNFYLPLASGLTSTSNPICSQGPTKLCLEYSRVEKKYAFVDNYMNLVEGELVLMMADRLKQYTALPLDTPADLAHKKTVNQETFMYLVTRFQHYQHKPYASLLFGFVLFDHQQRLTVADRLIAEAANFYQAVPKEKKYLYAWSRIKLLEIRLREAGFIDYATIRGRKLLMPDASREIATSNKELEELMVELSRDKAVADYFKVEYDQLKTVFFLIGKAYKLGPGKFEQDRSRTGKKKFRRTVFTDEAFVLNQSIRSDVQSFAPKSEVFFNRSSLAKDVMVLIQASERTYFENKEILEHIDRSYKAQGLSVPYPSTQEKNKAAQNDREEYILNYALHLLNQLEAEMAPPLPSYTKHKLEQSLGAATNMIPELRNLSQMKAQINALPKAITNFWRNISPENLRTVISATNNYMVKVALDQFISNQNATNYATLIAFIRALDNSKAFKKEYSEELVWDMASTRAELYHSRSLIYRLKKAANDPKSVAYQYIQSAYFECPQSFTKYDRESRWQAIRTKLKVKPDISVPLIQQHRREIWGF